MRNRKMFKATLVAAGIAAAVAVPAASADAATAQPDIHQQIQVYHGPDYNSCIATVASAEVEYGAADGFCSWDGFNWNGFVNID